MEKNENMFVLWQKLIQITKHPFTFHFLSLFASQKKQCYGIVYREQRDQLRYATSWREDIDTVAKNIRTVFMYKANVSDGPISINMG